MLHDFIKSGSLICKSGNGTCEIAMNLCYQYLNNCHGNGVCLNNGKCDCDTGFYGPDCSL